MKSFKQLIKNTNTNSKSFEKLNLALLSDQSSQFLSKLIHKTGLDSELNIFVWEAPIDQIEQQISNPSSEFNNSTFHTSIVFESSHALLKKYNCSNSNDDFVLVQFDRIKNYLDCLMNLSSSKIILFNFYELNDGVYGNFSSKNKNSFIYQLRKLNSLISDYACNLSRLTILDISSIQNRLGSNNMFDPSLYINYGMVLSLDSLPFVSKNIVDIIFSQKAIFKKCLILDLDNTLWGGIIGDDGIENIELGNLGIGKSFVEFQYWIKKLKQRGIIICICSKNNEDIAKNVFLNHPDMVLKLEDISVFVANWDSKVDNIKNIQKVLNIGFDSIVFLDDNPFERNSVKENIPHITVPDLPKDPVNYLNYLYEQNLFETSSVSDLDKNRTNLYQTEYERIKIKTEYTDLSDYMKNLNMYSKVEFLSSFNIPRVSQLSQRSNQFNLRTIRYDEDSLVKISNSDDSRGLVFDLKDKFGDYGIISFMVLKSKSLNEIFIENWAMSCRVLERGMEQFIFNYLLDYCKKNNINTIIAEYIATKKNIIVKDLYLELGFSVKNDKFILNIDGTKNLITTIKEKNE